MNCWKINLSKLEILYIDMTTIDAKKKKEKNESVFGKLKSKI